MALFFCKKCNTFSLFPFAIEEVCHIIHRMYNSRSFVSEKYETAELVPYHIPSSIYAGHHSLLVLGLFFWNPIFVFSFFFFCCSRKGPMDQILPQFGLKNMLYLRITNKTDVLSTIAMIMFPFRMSIWSVFMCPHAFPFWMARLRQPKWNWPSRHCSQCIHTITTFYTNFQ